MDNLLVKKMEMTGMIRIFSIKDTKLDDSVVTLTARDDQKLSKFLSEGFERSVY